MLKAYRRCLLRLNPTSGRWWWWLVAGLGFTVAVISIIIGSGFSESGDKTTSYYFVALALAGVLVWHHGQHYAFGHVYYAPAVSGFHKREHIPK